jgi:hypothetical protein
VKTFQCILRATSMIIFVNYYYYYYENKGLIATYNGIGISIKKNIFRRFETLEENGKSVGNGSMMPIIRTE